MATVLYGGSPRHHGRMSNIHHHIHHQNTLQSQQQQQQQQQQPHNSHYMSPLNQSSSSSSNHQQPQQQHPPTPSSVISYNSHHQATSSPILMPPASYLSTGIPMSSSSISPQQQQQQQQHSQQQQHHHHHHQTSHQQQIQTHIQYQQQQLSHYHHSTLLYPGISGGGGGGRHHKRRSAVEMLAESKQYYVKSETVLDRHQHLAYRSAGSREGIVGRETSSSAGAVACILSPVRTLNTHQHHHHHHHYHSGRDAVSGGGGNGGGVNYRGDGIISQRPPNRRSASSSSDLLQTKLRKLLNADAKDCPVPEIPRYKGSIVTAGTGKKYDTFSKYQSVKYNQELSIHPSNDQCDSNVLFPSAFLSPQSLPPHPASDDDIYSYGVEEPLVLTDDYRAISPPAEYAAVDSSPDKDQRCNYQRSYSHSHEVASDDPDYSSPSYNINSHKSLPDLHSQISRHSPHSEVLSCCSRGNRSNKSGGGSSLNRDSGGSSGHYTHRSEPCCKQRELNNKLYMGAEYRRDSGSSTQHSGNSYYTYGISSASRYDCPECRAKYQKDSECLLNFTTPEVPEAFQDEYPEQSPQQQNSKQQQQEQHSLPPIIKNNRFYDENKVSSRKLYSHNKIHQHQQQLQSPTAARTPDGSGCGGINVIKELELSPPLGTFKRQKCFRFKQRNRYSTSNDRTSCRTENICVTSTTIVTGSSNNQIDDDRKPILRSKSDISDRYWNRCVPIIDQSNKLSNALDKRGKSESLSQLEKFFDRLGLNDEKFEEIYSPKRRFSSDNDSDQSSTVFFSDVSTVDSTRLPDSTETQPQTQPYRSTEPPSIVERNARIIKWLCNCRKLALT